ncbi:hypothetical protein QQP08_021552, partial [Theobroma cacao]
FSGSFPHEISHLSKLVLLDLTFNYGVYFNATPMERLVRNLTSLREAFLNGVSMSNVALHSLSNFSSTLSNWTSPLKFLGIIKTRFLGELPNSIEGLESLEHLDLQGNFTGELPNSIGNMVSLKWLTLAGYFTGSILELI